MSTEEKPKVAAGEEIVICCPLCGVKFVEALSINVKHTCPDEGGCGENFLVKRIE